MGWGHVTHYRMGVGALAIVASAATGCIIDSDRCDAHQLERSDGNFALCVCEPNAVFNANGIGCSPCGANESPQNGECACNEGFARPSADAGCMASGLGAACNASAPCGAEFPFCTSAGYCSKQGCSSNADCGGEFTCESSGGARYCKKPPTGFGTSCTSDVDCASFEANACETLQQHSCIIQGCAQGTATCPNEWACCDYSSLASLIGKVFSVCAPPSMLTNGACPAPGVRVNP